MRKCLSLLFSSHCFSGLREQLLNMPSFLYQAASPPYTEVTATQSVYVDACAGGPYTWQATTTIAPLDADCFEVLFQYF